jgi:antitoxin component of MazEF toxin-antitoxin module
MKPVELKVARIGNSRGVRLPAATLERYHIGDRLVMEERVEGILLRPHGHVDPKLSWEDTAREMAERAEEWSEWDVVAADGLEDLPWNAPPRRRVAEQDRQDASVSKRPKKRSPKRS